MTITISLDLFDLFVFCVGLLGVILAALEYLGITKLFRKSNPIQLLLIYCGVMVIPITQAIDESMPGLFTAALSVLPIMLWILAIRVQMQDRWSNTHNKALKVAPSGPDA